MAILGQVRFTAWARARWSTGRSVTTGLGLMAASFLPLVVTAHLSSAPPAGISAAVLALTPALVSTVLLTLGSAIAYPFEMDTIVTLSDGRLVATHYGFYNTLSGIGITLGNLATGWIWGVGMTSGWPVLVWIVLTATGVVGTGALALLLRAGHLPSAVSPAVARPTPTSAAASGATGRTKR